MSDRGDEVRFHRGQPHARPHHPHGHHQRDGTDHSGQRHEEQQPSRRGLRRHPRIVGPRRHLQGPVLDVEPLHRRKGHRRRVDEQQREGPPQRCCLGGHRSSRCHRLSLGVAHRQRHRWLILTDARHLLEQRTEVVRPDPRFVHRERHQGRQVMRRGRRGDEMADDEIRLTADGRPERHERPARSAAAGGLDDRRQRRWIAAHYHRQRIVDRFIAFPRRSPIAAIEDVSQLRRRGLSGDHERFGIGKPRERGGRDPHHLEWRILLQQDRIERRQHRGPDSAHVPVQCRGRDHQHFGAASLEQQFGALFPFPQRHVADPDQNAGRQAHRHGENNRRGRPAQRRAIVAVAGQGQAHGRRGCSAQDFLLTVVAFRAGM